MSLDLRHFLLSHAVWIVAVLIGAFSLHAWLGEHDARLKAEAQEKASEQTITGLRAAQTQRDALSAQKVQTIVKVIHDTTTPQDAAIALPQVSSLPIPVVAQPTGDWLVPKADILPLFQQLADDAVCRTQLTTSQADLKDEKAIVVEKDKEITGYKKASGHHGFFGKVWGATQKVGLLGIGIALGRVL